jgi:hypothetical protein
MEFNILNINNLNELADASEKVTEQLQSSSR